MPYPAAPPPPAIPPPARHRAGFVIGLLGVIFAAPALCVGSLVWLWVAATGDPEHHPGRRALAADAITSAQLVTAMGFGLAIVLLVRSSSHQRRSIRATRAVIALVVVCAVGAVALWIWFLQCSQRYFA